MSESVQLITSSLLEQTVERARSSPRLRINHNFHPSDDANLHRFLNALVRGTYVTPHRHIAPPKPESFLVLSGQIAFFIFDEAGSVSRCYRLGEDGAIGIDVAAGTWHSMAVLSENAVIYEVKPGPYSPISDKEFAPFAPREGDPEAVDYLNRLLQHVERARTA